MVTLYGFQVTRLPFPRKENYKMTLNGYVIPLYPPVARLIGRMNGFLGAHLMKVGNKTSDQWKFNLFTALKI